MPWDDDDDWVGEPPEGRHTRDRAKPEFWRTQRPPEIIAVAFVLIPRCRASEGAAPSEGVNLPSAAFVLPIGAQVTAGRGGSAQAGTELVQSQLFVPGNSTIKDVVVT